MIPLHIPGHDPPLDITVFQDVSRNPGPDSNPLVDKISDAKSRSHMHNGNQLITYSRDRLYKIRRTGHCHLSDPTFFALKNTGLFHFRGSTAGVNRKRKLQKIKVISTNRVSNKRSGEINMHNLCPVKRSVDNNKTFNTSKVTQSSSSELEIIHLNIRSLKNSAHLIELRELVSERKSDIITISETWLNTSVTTSELQVEGYKLFRLDRLHKGGGGVGIYARKELKVIVMKDLSYISEQNFHQLWLNVQVNKLKAMIICVVYRPDDSPLNSFENVLKPNLIQAMTLNKPIFILGDLNCDCLKKTCSEFKALENFYTEMNLSQLIKSPTRITENTQSLLDVILVSSNLLVRDSGVIHRPISDHSIVFVKLKLKAPNPIPQYIKARSFKNYDGNCFTLALTEKADSLLRIFEENDVNSKLNTFDKTLQSTLNDHAPIKSIKLRSRPCPFVNQEIKDLMKKRDVLFKRYHQTRDVADWNNFKEYRNLVKKALREAEKKHTFEEVRIHKNNPGSLWKIINRAIPTKTKDKQIYSKDLKTVANEFNHFFSTVGRKASEASLCLAEKNNLTLPVTNSFNPPPGELFNLKTVTCEEVRRVVMALPLNKSPGPDKVNLRIIRDCLPVILGPLTDIINCSILSSTFPDNWKEAEVIPILKDGDHEEAANNRPLSLLAVASKICEKIVYNQFNTYLLDKNRLSPHQSGNKKAHSTETLNIYLTDQMLEAMDKKKLTALVLLDLSKAFDSIDHLKLLDKLLKVGASPLTVNWFKSYLSGRSQSVRIGSTLSDPLPITHGVPQGAILSPLLFCIYLNDLPSSPSACSLESYVDDSKLFLSFPLSETDVAIEKLELDLRNVAQWCCANNLLINPEKTKLLFIGTRQLMSRLPEVPQISFLGALLKPAASAKDLGVILDPHLTYDHHISYVISSCFSKLAQINRVKESFDKDTLELIIRSLVFSKMLYCSSVWSNTTAKNISKLQSIQNFACKIITNSRKYDHVTPLLHQLNWLPVRQLLLLKDSVLTYKCLNGLAPDYLCRKFSKRSTVHDRNTRSRNSLNIPLHKTSAGQRSFTYRAISIWNKLDDNMKQAKSLKAFKNAMKDYLQIS